MFKCVVNICNQDFGVYCRERDLGEKKRFGEQRGATKHAPGWSLDALVDHGARAGKVNWASWAVLAVLVGGSWLVALRSLLGWLWWHWIVLLGGGGGCDA